MALLLKALAEHAPDAGAAVGVDIADLAAKSASFIDVEAAGTGVKLRRVKLDGDLVVQGVKAGVDGNDPN